MPEKNHVAPILSFEGEFMETLEPLTKDELSCVLMFVKLLEKPEARAHLYEADQCLWQDETVYKLFVHRVQGCDTHRLAFLRYTDPVGKDFFHLLAALRPTIDRCHQSQRIAKRQLDTWQERIYE